MPSFKFNPARCIHCGICTQVCGKGLIRMVNGSPVLPEELATRCNNCGQCVAFCPQKASIQSFSEGVALEDSLPFDAAMSETHLRFLKSRRSIRNYDPNPLSHEEIMRILEATHMAPSGGNNRTLRWIVLEDPKKTRELGELIATWFDTVCRTHPVYSKRYAIDSILERYRAGKDIMLRGAPHVIFSVGPSKAVWGQVDTGIALGYFNLACEALDVGCCFAGYATKAAESEIVREFLGVKEGESVWCALCFGRKTLHPVRVPSRGPIPVTIL